MIWRRLTESLRVRLALALSVLTLIAAAPFALLAWQTPEGMWLATGFIVALLVAQCFFVSYFTRFIDPLRAWAREFARGKNAPVPELPDAGVPELRELGRSLTQAVTAVQHRDRSLAEIQELFEYSEQRLRKWAGKTGDVLFELDAEGRVTFVSPAWEALTDFSLADTIGKPLAGFFVEDDGARNIMPGQLNTLSVAEEKMVLRTRSGRRRCVKMSADAETNAAGETVSITGVISDITRHTELQQLVTRYEDELYQLSVLDPLTGLYNRRHFDLHLETILAAHLPKNQPVCLLLIDMDGFKFVNDTYGHPLGDEVLRTMARVLREQVRRNDYVARLAGDEFAMVLKNTGIVAATRIAQKLHANINNTRIPLPVGHMNLQASIGIVEAPRHGNSAQQLVSAADVALYHSRRHGPNRVETLSPDMSKAMISIFGQGFNLRRALEAGDIHPAFQPIFDMQRREPMAYEVLARMKVNGHVVQAQDFIGVAQELGLTREMDIHVIRRALESTPTERALFLNVDLQSFSDQSFIEDLVGLLEPARQRGRSITIEITERESVTPSETLNVDMRRLRALGCSLALDDFGSGYSTYRLLNQIRPDYLKIEGSFVRGMVDNEADHKIVSHIHELARSFGMQTIAESVENASIERALCEIGIRNAQGLHFGAPMLAGSN